MYTKGKRFWFHYNKPVSLSKGKPQISIHYNKQCFIVDNIVCNVPTEGKINKVQPKFVVQGFANSLVIENNICYVS